MADKLRALGKKGIGDKIYIGDQDVCVTYNALNAEEVKEFKRRAQMRHETFNGFMKDFDILTVAFCSPSDAKFATCFEACAVLTQYRLEHGEHLWSDSVTAGITLENAVHA